jgi:polyhydroxyalkanoate synthesis regulator phasin
MFDLPLTVEELIQYGNFSEKEAKRIYEEITNAILKKQKTYQILQTQQEYIPWYKRII